MADHTWKKKGTTIWQFKCEHKGRTYKQSLRTNNKRIAKAEAARLYLQIQEGTYRSPAEISQAEKRAERKILDSPTVRECYERYAIEESAKIPEMYVKFPRAKRKFIRKMQTIRTFVNHRFYFPKDLLMAKFTHDDLLNFVKHVNKYDMEVVDKVSQDIEDCGKLHKGIRFKKRQKQPIINNYLKNIRTIVNRCKRVWNISAPDVIPDPYGQQTVYHQLNFDTGLRFYELFDRSEPSKPKHVSKENLRKSLEIIGEQWPDGLSLLLFQLFSGCRIQNAINLQWQDIDWDNNLIHMAHAKGPINHSYTVPITKQLFSLLQRKQAQRIEHNIQNMYVFNYCIETRTRQLQQYQIGEYKEFTYCTVAHRLKKILSPHGLFWTTHHLRHTAATLLLQSGANLKHVQEQLGHSSIKTTMIYGHLDKSELARKMSKGIDEYLDEKSVRNTVLDSNDKMTKLL
jgi:integrase